MGYLMRLWVMIVMLPPLLLMAGCGNGEGAGNANIPQGNESGQPFSQIAPDTIIHLTGTEPFWSGEVSGDNVTYIVPDNPNGTQISIKRFAGRGGLSFSGELQGQNFLLALTPGECFDGMSDRIYPYIATLQIGDDIRAGCGWSEDDKAIAKPS
jgi:uncharacterized membrane protein